MTDSFALPLYSRTTRTYLGINFSSPCFSLYCIENLAIYIFAKRQGKTLGILTVAGSALSSGVGTAGSVLLSTAKVVGGLKTLALLGIGTSELIFWFFPFSNSPL